MNELLEPLRALRRFLGELIEILIAEAKELWRVIWDMPAGELLMLIAFFVGFILIFPVIEQSVKKIVDKENEKE